MFVVGLAFKVEIKESKGIMNGSHICYSWNQNISVSGPQVVPYGFFGHMKDSKIHIFL